MIEWVADPNAWIALLTLTAVEIVLGIDNIIFISILAGKLPAEQQRSARIAGLTAAMVMRILLLFSLTWMMQLTGTLFTLFSREVSGRDLILIGGGLFLLAKATLEIHEKLEGGEKQPDRVIKARFLGVIVQVMLLDVVFSLDSVITAIGLAQQLPVMVLAIVIAVLVMMAAAGAVNRFIDRHPTVRMLALSFLLLIGLALIGDGVDVHIPRSSIYFAMGFSTFVELLNLRIRGKRSDPVHLRSRFEDGGGSAG
jgi:predicted tellurium resistance membrane protein TerC